MDIAAAIFVWALVKRVRRPKKAVDTMEYAAPLLQIPIRTTNAILANATERAPATARKLRRQMEPHVRPPRNAHRVIARMAFVATVGVWATAKRARQLKKAMESTAYVATSPTIKTPMKNVGVARVMEKEPANNTMEFPALPNHNVCPGIASMACVAAIFATCNAKPVRKDAKAKGTTACVVPLRRAKIPTMNAILGNVAELVLAISNKRRKAMARFV